MEEIGNAVVRLRPKYFVHWQPDQIKSDKRGGAPRHH